MFRHIFLTRLKCLIRDKQTVFWTLFFPLVLATFFDMAFSNLNNSETFHPIDIAVVQNAAYQQSTDLQSALQSASQGDDRIFNLTAVTKEEADSLLNDNKIQGYIDADPEITLVVKESGLNQNIIKAFLDNYRQTVSAVTSILKENPMAAQNGLFDAIADRQEYTKEVTGSSAQPNNVLNYFYTLIAMSCLYGGFWGMREVTDIQANLSSRAARVNTAPVHKAKVFLYSLCAALLIDFVEMLLLLAYLYFGLKIDFGNKAGFVLLTTFVGCIVGISFGAFISSLVKKGEGLKVAILIAASMVGSFLSGMMYQDMKYIIAQNVPVLSYLNPANLLTDAFYSLYYYDTYTRYALNMGALGIFAVVFCMITYLIIRRQKYASL